MTPQFFPADHFNRAKPYRLLPFRFHRFDEGRAIVVNEVGEYLFLSSDDLQSLVEHRLPSSSERYSDLKAKHFLADSESAVPFHLLAAKYRTKKAHLAGFTKLHILVVSLRCEHSCPYCQVSRVTTDKAKYDMTAETASKALDLVFRSPADPIKVEFQGGEPLLAFERITQIVGEAEQRAAQSSRTVDFVVATNLALVTEEMLGFFRDHRVAISTSLDGPEFLHNANRPRPGDDSHQLVVANIGKARAVVGPDQVSALMTTSQLSLSYPREIVDEYVRQGFGSIFLRSVSPYGFATRGTGASGYSAEAFLRFYKTALDHILKLNREGTRFVETYAQLLLTRILTPFSTGYVDLQSPSGLGIAVAVYNYDGDVYASDESRMLAEMGDRTFRLGNVHTDSYAQIFGSDRLRSIINASCIESMPGCCDCAFQPYCGADPVYHYAIQGDLVGHRPTSDFHKKNFELITHLLKLYESDDETRRVFWSWVTDRNSAELI